MNFFSFLPAIILLVLLICILFFSFLNSRIKANLKTEPQISVIIPCYNDGAYLKSAVDSLFNSYEKEKIDLIIINDASQDNSQAVLKQLAEIYEFRTMINKVNLGKVESLNRAYKLAKNELILFLDADVIFNNKLLLDMLKRIEKNSRIGAVSCPYKPLNKGFLALMQKIEYNFLRLMHSAYNQWSCLSIWGGCFMMKKSALKKVGGFSKEAICEDIEMAFKLKRHGFRVEQSFLQISTYVPDKWKEFYKQKIRWSAGTVQCLIKHPQVWITHPIGVFFGIAYLILGFFFAINLVKQIVFFTNLAEEFSILYNAATLLITFRVMGLIYGSLLLKKLLSTLAFTFFSLPYVIPLIKKPREIWKLSYIIPFSIIYIPILTVISAIGTFKGIFVYRSLAKQKQRGW